MNIFIILIIFNISFINGMAAGKSKRNPYLDEYGINVSKLQSLEVEKKTIRKVSKYEVLKMIKSLRKLQRRHLESWNTKNTQSVWNEYSDSYKREQTILSFLLTNRTEFGLAEEGYQEYVDRYIEQYVDKCIDEYGGLCPLHIAVNNRRGTDSLNKILSLGADPDKPAQLKTALSFAVANQDYAKVLILLNHGSDPNGCFVFDSESGTFSIKLSDKERKKQGLKEGTVYLYSNIITAEQAFDNFPLAIAFKNKDIKILRLLLSYGAEMKFLNKKYQKEINDLIKW